MGYVTVSHWSTTEWTQDMEALATGKFIPMILSVGASSVQMVRTGELTFCVITQYENEEAGVTAQQKIAQIRSQAATELPMSMDTAHAGSVFASS